VLRKLLKEFGKLEVLLKLEKMKVKERKSVLKELPKPFIHPSIPFESPGVIYTM